MDQKFFDEDGYCIAHERKHCERCLNKASKHNVALVPLTVASNRTDLCTKNEAIENYGRQVKFIQTVNNWSEEELNKVKVKDIPNLLKKAQDNVTIGQMNKLVNGEKSGVIAGFFEGIACSIENLKRI